MRIKKIIAVKISVIFIISSLFNISSAHNQSGWVTGGEYVAWVYVSISHTNSNNLLYKFNESDPYFSTSNNPNYRNFIIQGAALWTNYSDITVSQSSSAVGEVLTYTSSSDGYNAKFYDQKADFSGHLTGWKIGMNRSNTPNAISMAHEFGHAIGLDDLSGLANTNKLMYGSASTTAIYPTAFDKWGAHVITGIHTHSSNSNWVQSFYFKDTSGSKVKQTPSKNL